MKTSINLADMIRFWESSGGAVMGGHFNINLYLKFLERYNSMSWEERSKKQ